MTRADRLAVIRVLYQALACFRHDTRRDRRAYRLISRLIRAEVDAFRKADR